MPVSSRALVEFVLLGPANDRRQLQDSPILGDVWIAFAERPAESHDLLLVPYKTRPAGPVAVLVAERLQKFAMRRTDAAAAHVAYLQGIVAARLFFPEVLRLVVPMTGWWRERDVESQVRAYTRPGDSSARLNKFVRAILEWAQRDHEEMTSPHDAAFASITPLDRYVTLAGLILWAGEQIQRQNKDPKDRKNRKKDQASSRSVAGPLAGMTTSGPITDRLGQLLKQILEDKRDDEPQIWQVSLNRKAMPALEKSVAAVKGDAARTLFSVKCHQIAWAVIDSGIHGAHPAFTGADGKCRIVQSFDFTNIREIVSLDNLDTDKRKTRATALAKERKKLTPSAALRALKALAEDANNDRPINWGLVEKFVEIEPTEKPFTAHGTHVAGIIGANGGGATANPATAGATKGRKAPHADGMCPDIRLYDFRVLGGKSSLEDTEFAIIAALQYIRYLNERHPFVSIHGVNLSLSIPHDVRNFACGRTPVCDECERLVASGVVVVAAAGNLGYHSFETKNGTYEGYAAFSITDPGNADGVITVGATHRSWPHTYGVSFFSSRGPTGDGRMKPDLVAPGERINSSVPDGEWRELDGTSMAAPHVSGAAAMLMARYAELVNQPQQIKRILCESATDLGRERSFQGHGMLDVLRAFQKV